MKTIIAGSRTFIDYTVLSLIMDKIHWKPTLIISGGARGVDKLGERYAKENNIPLEIVPAKWDLYGKKAGYIRNKIMAEKGEALVALWDGESRGTKMMIELAKSIGLVVKVVYV